MEVPGVQWKTTELIDSQGGDVASGRRMDWAQVSRRPASVRAVSAASRQFPRVPPPRALCLVLVGGGWARSLRGWFGGNLR